uniref:Glycosyl transferase family 2 n=1 Tax=Candidatus Kentrum sp. DK TaxID=2126562 RepID=A0A450SIX0_9GAMM|nr:MAG: hypothetical protein BECKDK2373B_GA0170837_10427 [Candidatus Kentron sp. DK]
MNPAQFPRLLQDRPEEERRHWARWVLGSHSDQFIPEMNEFVANLDRHDPIHSGTPCLNPGPRADDVIVLACNRGRHCVVVDRPPCCRVVLFDYTGKGVDASANPQGWPVISTATEGKGQIMEESCRQLGLPPEGHYMGFIDDDVMVGMGDLHRLLGIARVFDLSACQPAVSLTSSLSREYGFLRHRAGMPLHRVPIVEAMTPFLRRELLKLSLPFLPGIRSAYGFDRFALPLCAAHLGIWRFAAVDAAMMAHVRPMRSQSVRLSNGLLCREEELLMRYRLTATIGMFDPRNPDYLRLEDAASSKPPGTI